MRILDFYKKTFVINKLNKKRAFTLIETMIALSIFSISTVVFMSVMSKNLADINQSSDRITATFLASEGLEIVRNMRDTFVLYPTASGDEWGQFVAKMGNCDALFYPDGCYVDLYKQPDPYIPGSYTFYSIYFPSNQKNIINVAVIPCSGACPYIKLYGSEFSYLNGEPTKFRRTFHVKNINTNGSSHEMYVMSTVSWLVGDKTESISFAEYLYNWSGQ